jgi:cysteine desulfurase family protein (TIGR01976 family)
MIDRKFMSDTASKRARVAPTDEIREHFPALNRLHNGRRVAYFDGPGGTQVPRLVVERMADYLFNHNANTHWAYPTSMETDELLDYSRHALADFLNCSPTEVAFGANMTTLTFHLARTLGYRLGSDDEIIVTELDHHANVAPWRVLAKERGVKVNVVRLLTETGQIDWDELESLITKKTRLIALGAASNALGTINDLARAKEMARTVGAMLFIDAVHYAPHALVDVKAIDCDFLACSAYKFYGPHVGVLYGRYDLLDSLDFPRLEPAPQYSPERAETGTQNHEGIVGAAAAVDFLASLADEGSRRERLAAVFDALHARGQELTARLWQGLSTIEGVRLYGPPPDARRTPTVAFTVDSHASTEVSRRLAERGLFASHGDFYAATVIERLGLLPEGLVRAGGACYTTAEEIDRLLNAVGEL